MPARRRARRQDDPWIRRYKSLPLQNRHQVRHHLENNPYPEAVSYTHLDVYKRQPLY